MQVCACRSAAKPPPPPKKENPILPAWLCRRHSHSPKSCPACMAVPPPLQGIRLARAGADDVRAGLQAQRGGAASRVAARQAEVGAYAHAGGRAGGRRHCTLLHVLGHVWSTTSGGTAARQCHASCGVKVGPCQRPPGRTALHCTLMGGCICATRPRPSMCVVSAATRTCWTRAHAHALAHTCGPSAPLPHHRSHRILAPSRPPAGNGLPPPSPPPTPTHPVPPGSVIVEFDPSSPNVISFRCGGPNHQRGGGGRWGLAHALRLPSLPRALHTP